MTQRYLYLCQSLSPPLVYSKLPKMFYSMTLLMKVAESCFPSLFFYFSALQLGKHQSFVFLFFTLHVSKV